jgi:hypothetical protein
VGLTAAPRQMTICCLSESGVGMKIFENFGLRLP